MFERTSLKRNLILQTVRENRIHGTAEQICELVQKQIPGVGKATVYRNLQQFADNGEILKLTGIDEYDRYDGCTEPHIHFYCFTCKNIYDIMCDPLKGCVDENGNSVLKGFEVDSSQMVVKGECNICSKKSFA